jgi:alpha-D-ribose 1-methylphosphonate 5-triphosphate synthase subunit PhnI
MTIRRRISATFKDLPGGQVLGPTYDYTQRLLDFALAAEGAADDPLPQAAAPLRPARPHRPRETARGDRPIRVGRQAATSRRRST